jgi:hypothetical protein
MSIRLAGLTGNKILAAHGYLERGNILVHVTPGSNSFLG